MRLRLLFVACVLTVLLFAQISVAHGVSESAADADEKHDEEIADLMDEIPAEDVFAHTPTQKEMDAMYDDVSDADALAAQSGHQQQAQEEEEEEKAEGDQPNHKEQRQNERVQQLKEGLLKQHKDSQQSPLQSVKNQVDSFAAAAVDQFAIQASSEQGEEALPANNQPSTPKTFPEGSILYVSEKLYNKLASPNNRLHEERIARVKINQQFGELPIDAVGQTVITLPLKARPLLVKKAWKKEGTQWFVSRPDSESTEQLHSFRDEVQMAPIPAALEDDDINPEEKEEAAEEDE